MKDQPRQEEQSPQEDQTPQAAPSLKEIFNEARLRHIAKETKAVYPAFDSRAFLKRNLHALDTLSLMQRLRQVAATLHEHLPADYRTALAILRELGPRLNSRFVTMVLPEYVARYGAHDFVASMEALKFFTTLGSAEFAVRHFLLGEPARTLEVMQTWSLDEDEHVRRLASEGSRPRLPWSFRIPFLVEDPSPVRPILSNLKADPSLYVRKSVANHLNDITKDHPAWAQDLIESWPRDNVHTAWIARHALRTLIKKGDKRALALLGAGEKAQVRVGEVHISPNTVKLGNTITLSLALTSTAEREQRLVVDYAVHYVKKGGTTSPKVFKWKTFDLAPRASVTLGRVQSIKDFTTRTHYAGRHEIDILINGECLGRAFFVLQA